MQFKCCTSIYYLKIKCNRCRRPREKIKSRFKITVTYFIQNNKEKSFDNIKKKKTGETVATAPEEVTGPFWRMLDKSKQINTPPLQLSSKTAARQLRLMHKRKHTGKIKIRNGGKISGYNEVIKIVVVKEKMKFPSTTNPPAQSG